MKLFSVESLGSQAEVGLPADVADYPSLMSVGEKALLYGLAKTYTGSGYVIDAGVLLGASTFALAKGVMESAGAGKFPKKGAPVISYDYFEIQPQVLEQLKRPAMQGFFKGEPEVGKSFLTEFKEMIAPVASMVDVRPGDIAAQTPPGPIEIAYYDVLKSSSIDAAVFKAFAPHYIPGKTILVHREFFIEQHPYTKIRQEYFSDYFEFLGEAGPTAAYRLTRKLPDSAFESDPVKDLSVAEQCALLDQAASRTQSPARSFLTQLSKVPLVLRARGKAAAREALREVELRHAGVLLDGLRQAENQSYLIRSWRRAAQRIEDRASKAPPEKKAPPPKKARASKKAS